MSPAPHARPPGAPLLRTIYAVVFFGLALAAFTAAWPEAEQLLFALGRPYHFGEGPRLLALTGMALLSGAVVGVGVCFARRREIPLALSGALLFGVALCLGGLGQQVPRGRSWAAADKDILEVASKVQRRMVEVLQTEGAVPKERAAWVRALAEAAKDAPSPVRTRMFLQVPYDVERVDEEEALPGLLRPATLVVWVAPLGEAFQIHPIGFDPGGKVAPLADEHGVPVVLKGTFNPEMREPSPGPALPPLAVPGGFATP